MGDEQLCWICFEKEAEGNSLERFCKCPSVVHRKCLVRWQIQSTGKNEEFKCRFCDAQLPPWLQTIRDCISYSEEEIKEIRLTVHYKRNTYYLKVPYHPSLTEHSIDFEKTIKKVIGLGPDEPLSAVFQCNNPVGKNDPVRFDGLSNFPTIIKMAACNAFLREKKKRQRLLLKQQSTVSAQETATQMHVDSLPDLAETDKFRVISPMQCIACFLKSVRRRLFKFSE